MNVFILSYICQNICIYKIKYYICTHSALHTFAYMSTVKMHNVIYIENTQVP